MSYKKISPEELSGNTFKMIGSDWMLVSAADGENFNTMTASWGGMGVLWSKPVAFVFIRPQRYTYEFTERSDRLTLSFFGGEQREALTLCGKKSGRDCNKVAEAGLTPMWVGDRAPSFEEARVILSCRKLYSDDIKEEKMLDPSIMKNYAAKDFHRIYVCEIEEILVKED
ncbi:MAG: flavin reductase [Clostridia bacterium]|nr:flavin reductase [Clostridia bacterium]